MSSERKCRCCFAKGVDLYRELARLEFFDEGVGENGGEFPPLIILRRSGLHIACVWSLSGFRLFYAGDREIEHPMTDFKSPVSLSTGLAAANPNICRVQPGLCEHCGRLLGDRGPLSSSL